MRRSRWWGLLPVAFVVVPLVELYVIIQTGQVIGVLPTVAILLAVSLAGAWLVRREGTRAWSQLRRALREGRAPTREVVDGALVVFGGALLLTPGFVTDLCGLFFVVPPTRAVASRLIRSRARAFVGLPPMGFPGLGFPGMGTPGAAPGSARRGRQRDDDVIDVEVVDVVRADRDPARRRGNT